MPNGQVMGAVQELAQTLISGSAGFKPMLHVPLVPVAIRHNGAEVFVLVLDWNEALTSMNSEFEVELSCLHDGAIMLEASSILPHEFQEDGCLTIVNGHVEGFKSFKDECDVSYRPV